MAATFASADRIRQELGGLATLLAMCASAPPTLIQALTVLQGLQAIIIAGQGFAGG
jgi:hypothetical protein